MIKESKKRHKTRFISRYDQIMNQYYTCWYKPTDAVVKQRIWQQKQIDTFAIKSIRILKSKYRDKKLMYAVHNMTRGDLTWHPWRF